MNWQRWWIQEILGAKVHPDFPHDMCSDVSSSSSTASEYRANYGATAGPRRGRQEPASHLQACATALSAGPGGSGPAETPPTKRDPRSPRDSDVRASRAGPGGPARRRGAVLGTRRSVSPGTGSGPCWASAAPRSSAGCAG